MCCYAYGFKANSKGMTRDAICYASFYGNADQYFIDIFFDTNTKAEPYRHEDSATSRVEKPDVLAFVAVLRAAGFVFDYSVEPNVEFAHDKTEGHKFSIKPGSMNLLMCKFWLNFVRWLSNYPECVAAVLQAVKDAGGISKVSELDAFNMLCVCFETPGARNKNTNHSILTYGKLIVPMTAERYVETKATKINERCNAWVSAMPQSNTFTAASLGKPGGYKKYCKAAAAEGKKAQSVKQKAADDLKKVLGVKKP